MAKRMMADVLWEAANAHLPAQENAYGDPCLWSCNAAMAAEFGAKFHWEYSSGSVRRMRDKSRAIHLLRSLGVDPDYPAFISQGVRYMWLLLAMHVAEDEGLTC